MSSESSVRKRIRPCSRTVLGRFSIFRFNKASITAYPLPYFTPRKEGGNRLLSGACRRSRNDGKVLDAFATMILPCSRQPKVALLAWFVDDRAEKKSLKPVTETLAPQLTKYQTENFQC